MAKNNLLDSEVVIKLINDYPNDYELGCKIRDYYFNQLKNMNKYFFVFSTYRNFHLY